MQSKSKKETKNFFICFLGYCIMNTRPSKARIFPCTFREIFRNLDKALNPEFHFVY